MLKSYLQNADITSCIIYCKALTRMDVL